MVHITFYSRECLGIAFEFLNTICGWSRHPGNEARDISLSEYT